MSSDIEEYQEVVDKYYYAPEKNIIAAARQLAHIEYSKELVKVQRKDKDDFGSFVQTITNGTLNEINKAMAESIQVKLGKVNLEVKTHMFCCVFIV